MLFLLVILYLFDFIDYFVFVQQRKPWITPRGWPAMAFLSLSSRFPANP